ncbi:MAG: hypothetical protein Q8O14_09655 [bacterium]|jgi:hypothetical protein|nr:hypothetical protein [bacterium]
MKHLLLVLTLLWSASGARAELRFPGNPAFVERADAMRVNPALAAWQPLAFTADWQLLNSGLAGGPAAIGQGGFQLSAPRYNLVLLADLRDTDLLAESEICLDWGIALRPNLSLGLEAGLRRFGWNRDRLGADVLDDPVFRDGLDRLQPVLGAGAFWSPLVGLKAGLGLKRLNRPSLSLVSGAPRAPVRGYAGVAWSGEQLSLGLAVDNLRLQTTGDGLADELGRDLQPSLQAGWRALSELDLHADLRREGVALEFAARPGGGHEVAYAYTLPLGELADRSEGSHRLSWRYSLGGALTPGGPDALRPSTLPADRWREGPSWLDALRRRWRPERAPLLLTSRSHAIETVELHLHVEPALLERLRQIGTDPASLAAAGLGGDGRALAPGQSGVVRGTWSGAWWELSGWLERLAWEEGLRPVIHVGKREERLEDLANLLGATLEVQPLPALPRDGRLTTPDSLWLDLALPEELARLAGGWRLLARLPGADYKMDGHGFAPPARLAVPLAGFTLVPGEAHFRLEVEDRRGRLLAVRELNVPVVRRVRSVRLSEQPAGAVPPGGVDGIRIHLREE